MQSLMLAASGPNLSPVSVKPDKRGSEEKVNHSMISSRTAWHDDVSSFVYNLLYHLI